MLINEIKPSEYLNGYIRLFRVLDFHFPPAIDIPHKAYPPRPEHCLQFMIEDTKQVQYPGDTDCIRSAQTIFMGPHTKLINRYPGRNTLGIQIIFQPGAFFQLTKIPCNELTNLYLNAEDLFSKRIHLITEELCYAKSYAEMILILENFICTLVKKTMLKEHPVYDISKTMVLERDTFSLDKYLHAACLSHRQLDRVFKERIGISPKQFLQMARFDKAFRMKNRFPGKDWLSIALHCGYYDYQHLVKEYKEFTGFSPQQFFQIDNQAPERLLGDVEM